MTDPIGHLVLKLEHLASRDTGLATDVASAHCQAREIVSCETLATLERHVGPLPEAYRQWLLRVGSGPGPHHGLWSPERVIEETRARRDQTGSSGDVAAPAAITRQDVTRQVERLAAGEEAGEIGIRTNGFAGAVAISHEGCNGYAFLVTEGGLAGRMCPDAGHGIGARWPAGGCFWAVGLLPVGPSREVPRTFETWIEHWLDTALAQIGEEA